MYMNKNKAIIRLELKNTGLVNDCRNGYQLLTRPRHCCHNYYTDDYGVYDWWGNCTLGGVIIRSVPVCSLMKIPRQRQASSIILHFLFSYLAIIVQINHLLIRQHLLLWLFPHCAFIILNYCHYKISFGAFQLLPEYMFYETCTWSVIHIQYKISDLWYRPSSLSSEVYLGAWKTHTQWYCVRRSCSRSLHSNCLERGSNRTPHVTARAI